MAAPRLFSVLVIVLIFIHVQLCQAFRMNQSGNPILGGKRSQSLSFSRLQYGKDAPGFDTHKAVESIPDSLVRTIDGNDSMRKRFETLVRSAQVRLSTLILTFTVA